MASIRCGIEPNGSDRLRLGANAPCLSLGLSSNGALRQRREATLLPLEAVGIAAFRTKQRSPLVIS
ncbi:MAG: hypothetical protein AAFR77_17105 [Cyanobacteria bacterium J06631_2]